MAERTWTKSQADAIAARRGTVLVAAAAGSGKTAVLVERAVERLTDKERPTPADRMLIVTFTKAAAAEMRARLESRLRQMLREDPKNGNLRRQVILLSQAHIGTVDSFCAEMVREFFHQLDISPDFKILSDKQEEELVSAALAETVGEAFEAGTMGPLADAFSGERDDRRLTHMVSSLYRYMQSHPFPERWLWEKVALYEAGDASQWERVILEYARETAEYGVRLLTAALEEAREDQALEGSFGPAMAQDRQALEALGEAAAAGDWDEAAALQQNYAQARRGRLPAEYKEDPLFSRLENCRKEVKKAVEDLGRCLGVSREQGRGELAQAAPLVRGLAELTLDFSRRYQEKKRDRNFLDYSDLEHGAVALFCREDGSPTDLAREVSGRFEEIMIDEYQDINQVQDMLFRAVSRGEENLFMVGDVKQSIYGFRQAMPEIFLRARESYPPYDRERDQYPASIALDRNFRSRKEVVDTVNFVFSRLMSKEAGDIDYTGGERLVCAASYEEKPGCQTELQFLQREDGASAEEVEAAFIARRIKEMMAGGFTVTEKDGERPVGYGDFCVLLRSANRYAHSYARELEKLGIPARAAVSGGFFAAPEIQVMLSLLQVIDNPNQDIPLLAVLMSPLYGFSADDAGRLRAQDRKEPVYASLVRGAQEDPRCAQVLKDLEQYRGLAAALPADSFLTLLYGRTGYTDMVLAMEEGEERLANLRLLQRYARDYENTGAGGISGFLRFLDRLRQNSSDLQAAELAPGEGAAVSILSIHKSKGLEFPVCIVAGCGRNFVSDQREDVLLHPQLGLGVKLRDPLGTARYTTTVREAIALETARNAGAEELRVLYVALTRAKEKLILVASGEHLDRSLEKWGMEAAGGEIPAYSVRKGKNAGQWLALCALCHPDGGELRKLAGVGASAVRREDYTPWVIGFSSQGRGGPAQEREEPRAAPPDPALTQRLRQRMEFIYPYAGSLGVPAKVAASRLAAAQGAGREIALSRPPWLGAKGMTPAQRGTALHAYFQFADFAAAAQDPQGELDRLVAQDYLSPQQGEAVDLRRVGKFFESPLGQRVLRSPQVEKERRFTAVIPAYLAKPQGELQGAGEEEVVLQGAVDCTFVEDGKLHIIDFKTDRVTDPQELWDRYGPQIRLYGYAMEEVTGLQVGELSFYSTYLGQAVSRPYHEEN